MERVEFQSKSDGLCVVFECRPWVCAVPTLWIKGLLTLDEGRLITPQPGATEAQDPRTVLARGMLLGVGRQWFAAWDFGQMLELPSLSGAWLLLLLRHGERNVPLALRVGPCIAVEACGGGVLLPPGLFRARRAALEGAFVFNPRASAGAHAAVGLRVNPGALWTAPELDQSARSLASAKPRPEPRAHG
jgi:hypothetical protein